MLLEASCPSCQGIATKTGNVVSCPLCGDIVLENEAPPAPAQPEEPPPLDLVAIKDGFEGGGRGFTAQSFHYALEQTLIPRLPTTNGEEYEKVVIFALEYLMGYLEIAQKLPDVELPKTPQRLQASPLSSQCYALSLLAEQSGVEPEEILRRAVTLYLRRDE